MELPIGHCTWMSQRHPQIIQMSKTELMIWFLMSVYSSIIYQIIQVINLGVVLDSYFPLIKTSHLIKNSINFLVEKVALTTDANILIPDTRIPLLWVIYYQTLN